MCSCCLWGGVWFSAGKADLGDDGAHSTNEKLDLSNYISGMVILSSR
jgi:hypothetical protein